MILHKLRLSVLSAVVLGLSQYQHLKGETRKAESKARNPELRTQNIKLRTVPRLGKKTLESFFFPWLRGHLNNTFDKERPLLTR